MALVFVWVSFNIKIIFMFILISDETGTFDEDDLEIIPSWLFFDAESGDDSSLLIHCNYDCIIERPSCDEISINLPGRKRPVPPPRPTRALDYIQVILFLHYENIFIISLAFQWYPSELC